MSLVPEKRKTIGERSLEVTRSYIKRSQTVTRSVWIKTSPKNPLAKIAFALPMAALGITLLILFW
jgi:ribosomal protein L16/L10AE